MKHNILPFEYNGVRLNVIADQNGDPEFEVNALCELLQHSNPSQAIKQHIKEDDLTKREVIDSLGRKQRKNFVKERGMWKLLMKSNAPNAEPVQDWIAGEVLPSIRKTGSYTAASAPKPLAAPDLFPKYFKVAKLIGCDRNLAAISANNAVFQKTGENVLKLLGHTHMETPDQQLYFNVSDLVDGISGQRMNKMLMTAGLQTRDGDRWIPTDAGQAFSRIYDTGKRHGDGMPVQAVRWTRDVLPMLSLGEAA